MNYKNKKILVYGLGKSGINAIKLLLKIGAKVYAYDDNFVEIPDGVIIVDNIYDVIFDVDFVVLSPGVEITGVLLDKKVREKCVSELDFAYSFLDANLIGVTGTNGKTTVTLMINDILNRAGHISYAVGNIGIPLSEKVLNMTGSEYGVCEVSSYQLEMSNEFSPDIAVLTNITSDHLLRHKTIENYRDIKARIFKNQVNKDVAILNADDKISMQIEGQISSDKYFFSTEKRVRGAYIEGESIYFEDKGKIRIMGLNELANREKFNIENALATVATCVKANVNPEIIRMGLRSFSTPKYRMTYLGEKRGKKVYNDSKATNISSTLASAKEMDGNTILIVGGRKKGENYEDLFKNLPKNVTHVFVFGENSTEIMNSAINTGFYSITLRNTLKECFIESISAKCDNILFSPASSSFDKYANYVDRGRAFDELFSSIK